MRKKLFNELVTSMKQINKGNVRVKKLRPVHPGDILLHDFMEPLKLSAYKLAKELGVSAPTVNEIVRRRRAVTAEMALRLSRYFGTSVQLWQILQGKYDLEVARGKFGKKIDKEVSATDWTDWGKNL